jgi:heme A synthase
MTRQTFARFAWFVLALNVAVILWGAVVRATGAGAGCGEHWPLCNGQVIPPAPQIKTLIEYGHRLTSGVALLCVVALVYFAFKVFPKGHWVRRAATASLALELLEGLLGASLVLLGHVAENRSSARGYSQGLHLTNTLLLLAALTLTARFAGAPGTKPLRILRPFLVVAALGVILIGITGGIAALGDTLFTTATLAEGMRQDFDTASHPFVRLRIFHPIIAVLVAIYVLGLAAYVLASLKVSPAAKKLGWGLIAITIGQLCVGAVNLLLLAPVPIQIAHLFLADLLWITFILLSTELLTPAPAS